MLNWDHLTGLKLRVLAGVALVSGAIGCVIGVYFIRKDLDSNHPKHRGLGENYSRDCSPMEASAARALDLDPLDQEYMSVVRQDHLEAKARAISLLFSQTDVGRALARSTTLMSFEPNDLTPEGRITSEAYHILVGDPQATFTEIQAAMSGLSLEMTGERQFLIQLAAKLNLDVGSKLDLLVEEFERIGEDQESNTNSPQEIERNKLNSSVILWTMMGLDPDVSVVDPALRQLLGKFKAYDVRTFLLSIYQTKFPEEASKIRVDLGMQQD